MAEDLTPQYQAFRAELVDADLLIPASVDGLYARTAAFERIIEGIDRLVVDLGQDQNATVLRFPPVMPEVVFQKTDYLASFPDLTGSVHSFTGDDLAHKEMLRIYAEGGDWTDLLEPSEVMLIPAACHPSYPLMAGTLPEGGRKLDVYGYCFRHEPSLDPTRMQAFRMPEYVYIGTPEGALAHRQEWVPRGLQLLSDLDLEPAKEVANDPFFGRAGRMLAVNQRDGELKYELTVQTFPGQQTAVVSCNYHEDHFGKPFGIFSADGAIAHSSCVGFGMERIALALLTTHGVDTATWPQRVRELISP